MQYLNGDGRRGKKTQFIWKVAREIFDEPVEKDKPPDLIKKIED